MQSLFAQVHRAQHFRIIGFDRVHYAREVDADLILDLVARNDLTRYFSAPSFKSLVFGGPTTIQIDDCVAEDSIRPAHDGFLSLQFSFVLKGPHVCCLENVLSRRKILNAALHKTKELVLMLEKRVERRTCHPGQRGMRGIPPLVVTLGRCKLDRCRCQRKGSSHISWFVSLRRRNGRST